MVKWLFHKVLWIPKDQKDLKRIYLDILEAFKPNSYIMHDKSFGDRVHTKEEWLETLEFGYDDYEKMEKL